MDLFCPHCTRKVTVADDQAGLVLNCPLCAKQFQAPSLAPAAPVPPPPVPASLPSYDIGPAPPPPPPPAPLPTPKPKVDAAPAAPPPPVPPGDYTRTFTLQLRGQWLPFVPPACLILILVLSFFNWHHPGLSLWGLAFTEHGKAQFLAYTILLFPCILVAVAATLFEMKLFVAPPQAAPLLHWKDLLVTLLLLVGVVLLTVDYLNSHFAVSANPIMLAMKLAIRLHIVAMTASVLMFWLQWRKRANLPPPKMEVRW